MGLSDLLEGCLDFSNSITLKVLNLLERGPNDSESLWINSSGGQQLVDLGIFGLKTLLDCLMLLLEDKVPDTCLLMDLISQSMELVKELLLFFLLIFELLKSNFKLPLDFFRSAVEVRDLRLSIS
jgi:hypothetical protein